MLLIFSSFSSPGFHVSQVTSCSTIFYRYLLTGWQLKKEGKILQPQCCPDRQAPSWNSFKFLADLQWRISLHLHSITCLEISCFQVGSNLSLSLSTVPSGCIIRDLAATNIKKREIISYLLFYFKYRIENFIPFYYRF